MSYKFKLILGLVVLSAINFSCTQNQNNKVLNSDSSLVNTNNIFSDENDSAELQDESGNSFVHLQWGLHNLGQAQFINLDPMIIYKHQGQKGEDIHLPPRVKTGKKILVAVLDTGIDYDHPDLKNIIHTNPTECVALEKFNQCVQEKGSGKRVECEKIWMDLNNPEVDLDKNGFPLDCHGWSVLGKVNEAKILGQPDFQDSQGHGTHVAGIIAAQVGNSLGLDGVSQNVEILPVQVIGTKPSQPLRPMSFDLSPIETKPISGNGDSALKLSDLIARGIRYAIRSGAQVISMSLGWPESQDSPLMREAILEAQKNGIIIVAAAGNDSTRALLRPCSYEGVICVGAQRPDGAVAHFSNYGSGVDILAPGINILSTYPIETRPILFGEVFGYDYLSGTSQATPFVAGAVAELLSRGIPSVEIYPRLVLGARPIRPELPLVMGNPHEESILVEDSANTSYEKYILSGNLDIQNALKETPKTLILPLEKEKIEVPWDRKNPELKFQVKLKNHWSAISTSLVRLDVSVVQKKLGIPLPKLISFKPLGKYSSQWMPQEVRTYEAVLKIIDALPEQTRIGSEFDLEINFKYPGSKINKYILNAEIVVALTPELSGKDVENFPISNFPKGKIDWIPIYEKLDGQNSKQDYFLALDNGNKKQLWIVSQDELNGAYSAKGGTQIKVAGEVRDIVDKIQTRLDWDQDGHSEYIIAYVDNKSQDSNAKTRPFSFFVFDSQMKLKDQFVFNDDRSQMLADMQWQRVGQKLMPTWVGPGFDPYKKRDLLDIWVNPDNIEEAQIRLYYLDEKKSLQAISEYEEYHIVDLLAQREDQKIEGVVSILLAKNRGTELQPSYIYDFAVAEVVDGQIRNFQKTNFFDENHYYRNLLDTRVDKIFSLDPGANEFAGTFWFGKGRPREQRVSLFDSYNFEFSDFFLSAERKYFDAALWARAVYSGSSRKGAFVFTNYEIQYHNLVNEKVSSISMDRYSFFPANITVNLQFPVVLKDYENADSLVPGLLNTEGSGLNRGLRLTVPRYNAQGEVLELFSPARLRFSSQKGCRSLEAPFYSGGQGHSLDYYCGDKIMRVNLSY